MTETEMKERRAALQRKAETARADILKTLEMLPLESDGGETDDLLQNLDDLADARAALRLLELGAQVATLRRDLTTAAGTIGKLGRRVWELEGFCRDRIWLPRSSAQVEVLDRAGAMLEADRGLADHTVPTDQVLVASEGEIIIDKGQGVVFNTETGELRAVEADELRDDDIGKVVIDTGEELETIPEFPSFESLGDATEAELRYHITHLGGTFDRDAPRLELLAIARAELERALEDAPSRHGLGAPAAAGECPECGENHFPEEMCVEDDADHPSLTDSERNPGLAGPDLDRFRYE